MRQALFLLLLASSACSSSSSPDEPADAGTDASLRGDSGGGDAGISDSGILEVDAAAYSDTCTTAADCVLVQGGDACNPCPSGSFDISINQAGEAAYEQALAALKAECPKNTGVVMACPAIVTFAAPVCNAGTCGVCTTPGCDDAGAHDAGDAGDANDAGDAGDSGAIRR